MKKVILLIFLVISALAIQAQTNNSSDKFYAEDIFEYVPSAAIFSLKAFDVDSKHNIKDQLIITSAAFAVNVGIVEVLKHTINSERPDHSNNHSFPSGHTAIAFLGADMLYNEYRNTSPWIGIGGYALATSTGILRVHHDRHHWGDVIAGAAIGMGCSRLSQWLTPKIFCKQKKKNSTHIISNPSIYKGGMALDVCLKF